MTLRNIQITGPGVGFVGIRFFNGKRLILENVLVTQAAPTGVLVTAMAGAGEPSDQQVEGGDGAEQHGNAPFKTGRW